MEDDTGIIFVLEPETVLGKQLTGIRIGILHGAYNSSMGLNGWARGILMKEFANKSYGLKPIEASMRIRITYWGC